MATDGMSEPKEAPLTSEHTLLSSSEPKPRASELEQALRTCDFPLVVWELPSGVIHLANEEAATLSGRPLDDLIGRKIFDLVAPDAAVEQVLLAFSKGIVNDVQSQREVLTPDGNRRPTRVWSRSIDLAENRAVVSLLIPIDETARLGRDPSAPWRDLVPITVGIADRDWHVRRVSNDINSVLGTGATDCTGRSLLDQVHPDDRSRLMADEDHSPLSASSHSRIRFRRDDGQWMKVCVLTAPLTKGDGDLRAFAIVGPRPGEIDASADRIAKLEMHLRLIGAEVRAAGLLEETEALPASSDIPQLASLTSRQWQILSRLMRGDRVPTIARELFVSQSTVRNHLTAIFQLFGVHSQAELLAKLRGLAVAEESS